MIALTEIFVCEGINMDKLEKLNRITVKYLQMEDFDENKKNRN